MYIRKICSNAGKAAVILDDDKRNDYSGIVGSFYFKSCICFRSLNELIFIMEDLFNTLQYPMQTVKYRMFKNKASHIIKSKRVNVMEDISILTGQAEKTTFIINVLYRQNASWQGNIHWVNQNQTMNFRSLNELIKLMNSAMTQEDESIDWEHPCEPESTNQNE